ncbi:MAG: A/G-specific adenine glycosylase [Cytophagales bacterium]|nr:MAG: A/G-specific adenine glycosylase [Cytophagales bacterium]
MKNTHFSTLLIDWYKSHHRDLPWRNTQNPYFIWLSEVILQQTRVKQGLPYYQKFVTTYPTVKDLAEAPLDEVLRLWQGLGYYSRARNLHTTAKDVLAQYNGNFPTNYEQLLALKGIGKYTAAAIASFAANAPIAVLDGNVYRVLARFFGNDTDIASPAGEKVFREIAQTNLPPQEAAIYNQALMEFGALQCTPQNPDCLFCPLQKDCAAYNTGKQNELPVKNKKIKIKQRYFYYLIFQSEEGKIALKKRNGKGIWEGLYDFFLIENEASYTEIALYDTLQEATGIELQQIIAKSNTFSHQLTHQRIEIIFVHIRSSELPNFKDLQWYSLEEAHLLPKPIIIANYIDQYFRKKQKNNKKTTE